MTVTAEILATWRDPAGPVGRLVATGPREDRSLAILMAAAVLMFVARAPSVARAAHLDPSAPLDARLGITLFAMLFLLPLLAYGLALALHLCLRALGRQGAASGARIALFWSFLALSPALLLQGLAEGMLGQTGAVRALGLLVFAAFLWFLLRGLAAAYPRAD
ncbi:YIP1 family protein [Frigidibacter sp. RF13]|uniref:YIP1 family protein n=1 Tax=Frigidibacter sp. RF13 TaxID=2997340 RepID=UPI00226E9EF4|nr:YIP1 family protein [Frigidibacter sp. RF13]MCY1125501.1 YIP1 family protein [Frigidibacter sp. RF13]